jgi:hypothetical protein
VAHPSFIPVQTWASEKALHQACDISEHLESGFLENFPPGPIRLKANFPKGYLHRPVTNSQR